MLAGCIVLTVIRSPQQTSHRHGVVPWMENLMTNRVFRVAAAAVIGLLTSTAIAQSDVTESILVTATRLDMTNTRARGNTTIITAADIEDSTARTLPELLGQEAGILGSSLFGNNGTLASIDIRGFGAAATQNTLILLDGRRLNDVDLSSVNFGTIPLQSIERIEITRNSGSVLYGDGAVGGAINIITRKPEKTGTSAFLKAGAGNLDTQQLDAHASHNSGAFATFVGAHGISSDGYRDNNKLREKNINSDFRYSHDNNQYFLKLDWFDQDLDLPGVRNVNPSLGINQLKDDRRGTDTPDDYADQDGYRINPGFTHYWDSGSEAVIDFGYHKKNQQAFYGDYQYGGLYSNYVDSDLKTFSFTPRATVPHTLFGKQSQTIVGLDYYSNDYDSKLSLNHSSRDTPIHKVHIDQQSTALYADSTTTLGTDITVNLGARLQWIRQKGKDRFDPNAPGADPAYDNQAAKYNDSYSVPMFEAGLEKQLIPSTSAYIKWTHSARVATVDELFEYDPNTSARVFSPLEPQTGNGIDLGTRYRQGRYSGNANAYYLRLKNEIHFDPVTFSNTNLDPTERYGLELTGAVDVNDRLSLQGNYSYMRSRFTDGPFEGNSVPLVPENKASLSGIWQPAAATDLVVAVNYVDSRYFDNDQSNRFGEKIPSYTTVDAKLSHSYRGYRMTFEVNNIFAEEYYEYGASSFSAGVYNAYPLPERTILFTVAKEFGKLP
jgi:iron complex outermembrane receptor protein